MFSLFQERKETRQLFSEPLDGIADETITPKVPGRAFFEGTYWPAQLYDTNSQVILFPGQPLKVIGMNNITLLVMPA
jgi:membrane protein implicated in regulation of membrane protease activity